ncbi:hypothetical protein GCM10009434_26420 [Brevundimonas olei]
MRGLTRRMMPDCIQNQIWIRQHGLIAEAQDSEAASLEVRIARSVLDLAQPMDATVQFDHQPEFIAAEISDPAPDTGLSPELVRLKPSTTQDTPHRRFGGRHRRSQSLRLVHRPLIRPAPRATFSHEGRRKNRDIL